MGETIPGRFVSGDDLAKELFRRKKTVIYESAKGKSLEVRQPRINELIQDGWRVSRHLKTSTKLEKDKPTEEQLEDEVWRLMTSLGFSSMSEGRHFKLFTDGTERQVDIVAVDQNAAVVIECTQSRNRKTKALTPLIEKVETWKRRPTTKSMFRERFGNPDMEVAFLIATRNIDWRPSDKTRAEEAGIKLLIDDQIDYFRELVAKLKFASRYQFLGYAFREKTVPGLVVNVPATKFKAGKKAQFYSCLVPAQHLLKISYINHKANATLGSENAYQRMAATSRLKEIAKFIDRKDFEGTFPTNLVINIHTKGKKNLKHRVVEDVGGIAVGELNLPPVYGSAFVIDGQHRLFGYAHSERGRNPSDTTSFLVLAYDNLSVEQEGNMFVSINSKQKAVAKGLLRELQAELYRSSDEPKQKLLSLTSSIVQDLAGDRKSKLYDRVTLIGTKRTTQRCLSLEQLAGPLEDNNFFGSYMPAGQHIPGPLSDTRLGGYEADRKKAKKALNLLFDFMATRGEKQFELGKDVEGGFLWSNVGMRPFLGAFKQVLDHLEKKDGTPYCNQDPDLFMPEVCKYLEPVIDAFEGFEPALVEPYKKRRAMQGVSDNQFELMLLIRNKNPSFKPKGLSTYEANLDEEGTYEANKLIRQIDSRLNNFIRQELTKKYGEKIIGGQPRWFREGVPERVRDYCLTEQNKEQNPSPHLWQYLNFIHYKAIITQQGIWTDLFKDTFESPTRRGEGKKAVDWMLNINNLRRSPAHGARDFLKRDEVQRVRDLHRMVMKDVTLDQEE